MASDRREGRSTADIDPAVARSSIRERAEEIRRQELERALARLEADGELTDEEREAVEELATALVDRVLTPAEETLEHGSADAETLRTAAALFDPEE